MLMNSGLTLAILEAEQRRYQSKTYTEPLDQESLHVQEYYSSECNHMNKVKFLYELKTYSESVGEHYKYLVPEQVSEDDFRSRYLYRCDVINIMKEWASQPNIGSLQRNVSTSMVNGSRTPCRGQIQRTTSNSSNPSTGSEEQGITSKKSGFSLSRKEFLQQPSNWSQKCKKKSSRNLQALQLLEEARGGSDEYNADNVCFQRNRRVARGA